MKGRALTSRTFYNSTRFLKQLITDREAKFEKNKAILDYVLEHSATDERPYVTIEIMGCKLLALLDSGANRTILGRKGWEILSTLGLRLNKQFRPSCSVANGAVIQSSGVITLPIQLNNKITVTQVLVVPDVPHTLILGIDFWKSVGIVPDVFRGEWKFSNPELAILNTPTGNLQSKLDLTNEQQTLLNNLVEQHFAKSTNEIGCAKSVEHKITTTAAPIKQRYYPVSPAMQKHIDAELDKMLEAGIIERSKSAWSSPILLVKKKEGTYRFCVDFRKLNSVTEKDAYPLPYVSAILDRLRDARFITSLDIKSAYWQIPMEENSKQYTAFTVPNRGLFHFNKMPFGLHNAPATWQRLMDNVLGPELEPYVFVYLDDVIICTPTFEKHLEILNEVLKRLGEAGLTLGRDKCHFCKPELRYLGYVVNSEGLLVDPDKVSAILQLPQPKNVSEIRRIIGMASWYRRFIPNFSSIIAPLTSLLRKNHRFEWTETCEIAFTAIKDHLVSSPILTCPDFNLPFSVQTDASNVGIGAVLTQNIEGQERVICYISRSLTKSERNFSVTERECLAVLWAIERLRPYLEGTHFTVITDHHSLIWLNNLKEPTGRLARWAVRIQQYDFTIQHRKGKDHVVPDALSRAIPAVDTVTTPDSDETDNNSDNTEINSRTDRWYYNMRKRIVENPLAYPKWKVHDDKIFKHFDVRYPELTDEDSWKEVIPKSRQNEILKKHHDEPTSGHLGIYKTHQRIAQKYYWPKLKSDVTRYVNHCTTCIANKPEQKRPAGLMSRHPIVTKPWQMISIDIVGPLPRSTKGYVYILSVADYFTKFTLFFPLRTASANAVIERIENDVFLLFGVPQYILVDNGVQFRSKEFQTLTKVYKSKVIFNAYYHAQANPVERVHRVLKTMLASYVRDNHRTWDQYLPKVACAVRTAVHEVIQMTPYFANFGREIQLEGTNFTTPDETPLENIQVSDRNKLTHRAPAFQQLYDDIVKRLDTAYKASKVTYDLRRRPATFSVGDTVWRRNYVLSDASKYFTAKLAPKFVGPFYIANKVSSATYELTDASGASKGTWHAKDLKANPTDD